MANLFVTCPCGQRIPVNGSMAGRQISCQCGRALLIPSLRALQAGHDVSDFVPARMTVAAAAPPAPRMAPETTRWSDDPNPYASPQTTEPAGAQAGLPERNLSWLLFSFQGRIPRRAYWGATLGTTAVLMVVMMAVMLGLMAACGSDSPVPMIVVLLLEIPTIWITLAIQAKRWHDRDKSGWWSLIGLIPYIGGIWVLIECGCLRGTMGPNSYGPDPT